VELAPDLKVRDYVELAPDLKVRDYAVITRRT
jgi:hypothetical protein